MRQKAFITREVLGVTVSASSYLQTVRKTILWAEHGESRTVVFANVHVVMEARDSLAFRSELNTSDLINPDGVPLVWALRALGIRHATRVYGPDTMRILLRAAELSGLPVGFYGGSTATLTKLLEQVRRRYPALKIAFDMSPPFRPLTNEEDAVIVERIRGSGARLLFVGLGCPKQERWVNRHRGQIPAVMLAVGAAFDFLAQTTPQAPRWMMRVGLEWAFRLASEPRRLAARYLKHNPRFVFLFFLQWITQKGRKYP